MDSDFAKKAVIGMWLGSVGITVYKEFNNPNNPGKPLPRPCKLVLPAIGYTGLGILASFAPTVGFVVAVGITFGAVMSDSTNIFVKLASSLQTNYNIN